MRLKRRTAYIGAAIAASAIVLSLASSAFACTTYQGNMTVKVGTTTSSAQGDNNCTVSCGAPNGSMMFCHSVNFGATADPDGAAATALITEGATTSCPLGNNEFLANQSTVHVDWVQVGFPSGATALGSESSSADCMWWNSGTSAHPITTTSTDGSGAVSVTINIPTTAVANSGTDSAGICLSYGTDTAQSNYGNEVPLTFT